MGKMNNILFSLTEKRYSINIFTFATTITGTALCKVHIATPEFKDILYYKIRESITW
jgi:hypothetical protein